MQIPILSGIYSDGAGDLRSSYPVNRVPVALENGVSAGYLRPADGLVSLGTGPGACRGGIAWNGVVYRVFGTKLCRVSDAGAVTVLGDVGGYGPVTMDYSFDVLGIVSGGRLFYWDGSSLTQLTDPDAGTVLDATWIGGYWMFTDGRYVIVTELNDRYAVSPLKYGSTEVDPDPIVGVVRIRNEAWVPNRYTIEVLDNVGGQGFPFARIDGAQIQKGVVGTHAFCIYLDAMAFVGSGRNEALGVYVGANSVATKISTQEIDRLLLAYTDAEAAQILVEARNDSGHQHLYVHLPDRTVVYDAEASKALGQPVWFTLTTALAGFSQYRGRHFVFNNGAWTVADPQSGAVGVVSLTTGAHWGSPVRWEFGTLIAYNEGRAALFQQLELVALTGRVQLGVEPRISTSYSVDGQSWSQSRAISAGTIGASSKRLVWFGQGFMQSMRIQRFTGDSSAHLSFARLEAKLEGLAY